jgi:hypothetical protein
MEMIKDMKAFLKRKKWKGKEIGEALLMSITHDIQEKDNPKSKPLLTQEDYRRMLNSLTSEEEYNELKFYQSIYSVINEAQTYMEGMKQQFFNGYYRFLLAIQEAERAEEFYKRVGDFPLIMTQAEYDNIFSAVCAIKREQKESYYSLFFHTIEVFMDFMEEDRAEEVPQEILEEIRKTQGEKVTNKRILANWAADLGEGFYTLQDGRRSDSMTLEEWQEALQEEYLKEHKYIVDGEEQSAEETAKHFNLERMNFYNKALFEGGEKLLEGARAQGIELGLTAEEAEQLLENIIDEATPDKGKAALLNSALNYEYKMNTCTWHYIEVPEDLTKYDILADTLGRYAGEYSERLLDPSGDPIEEISKREQYKEFTKDYPGLTEAVKDYVAAFVPQAAGLKANQYYKDIITWGELADLYYMNFDALLLPTNIEMAAYIGSTTKDYNKKIRAACNGIAIINKDSYKDPIEKQQELQGLEYLEKHPQQADYIQKCMELIVCPALRQLYSYNALIDIYAELYEVDFLKGVKYDMDYFESMIENSNNLLYLLYREVYGSKEEIKKKRRTIKEYFRPIEVEPLRPSEKAIGFVKEELRKLGHSLEAAKANKEYLSLIREMYEERPLNE